MNVKKMAVFRIETADHEGPYAGGAELDYSWSLHPHLEDEGFDYAECELFGFPSITALETWFYSDLLQQLLKAGKFGLAIYSVPSDQCIVSPTQLAFCQDEADQLGWMNLDDAYGADAERSDMLTIFIETLTTEVEIVHPGHEWVEGRKTVHEYEDGWTEMSID